MRRDTYLNVVLTIIAILLTVDVWTRVAERPLFDGVATAQSRSQPNRLRGRKTPPQTGVSALGSESVEQRALMIRELAQIREQFSSLRGLLESGAITVTLSEPVPKGPQGVSIRR